MVRNNSAGVSNKNTRLDRSLTAVSRTQPSRAATKPAQISKITGKSDVSTSEFMALILASTRLQQPYYATLRVTA